MIRSYWIKLLLWIKPAEYISMNQKQNSIQWNGSALDFQELSLSKIAGKVFTEKFYSVLLENVQKNGEEWTRNYVSKKSLFEIRIDWTIQSLFNQLGGNFFSKENVNLEAIESWLANHERFRALQDRCKKLRDTM